MMNPFKSAGASSSASARLRRALIAANAAEVRRALDQLKTSPDEGVAALPLLQQLVSAGDARCVDILRDLAADKANAGTMIETRGLVHGLLVLAQTAPEAVDVLQNLVRCRRCTTRAPNERLTRHRAPRRNRPFLPA